MKFRITILLLLVCLIGSFRLLTAVEAHAGQTTLELVIPEETATSESMIEIEKGASENNEGSIRKKQPALPTTGEVLTSLTFIGGCCLLFSLTVFRRKRR
ncbi:LPXTG cell wall anchor domain-containing protein [uncultured Enterococcus sp.]|uniref:LPXTG cell wall anchor domain-containing protein n=1 Tax=uncultured Enterococcus sp. TaxID=167972 RepID=UPI002AA6A0A2|nr:LPXTG cell wall anchor domain-containing protein [uncultured Enterococcus sp.]